MYSEDAVGRSEEMPSALKSITESPAAGGGKVPLLIILHGLTGYKEEPHLAALAEMCREIGFASLRPDLYGHGESGGSFREHDLRKWIAEIRELVSWARAGALYSGIYLCGHSQGALCALIAAGKEQDIAGVIALAPALKIPEQARKGTLFGLSFDPEHVPDEAVVWDKVLSGNYIREAQSVCPEEVTAYKGPVLFVHSDADERVPVSVSEEAVKAFGNAQIVITHGDTHDFDLHPEEMTKAVRKWLLSQL